MNSKIEKQGYYEGVDGLFVREVQENFIPKYEKYGVMVASDVKDLIKYILRAPEKNGLEDLEKGQVMLGHVIEGVRNSKKRDTVRRFSNPPSLLMEETETALFKEGKK